MSDDVFDCAWPRTGSDEINDDWRSPQGAPDYANAQTLAPAPSAIFDLASFAEDLSRLGPVLWLSRQQKHAGATSRQTLRDANTVMLDHPALAALGRCERIERRTLLTSQGPREWLALVNAFGENEAKLFLLPDSDYFAWDSLTEAHAMTGGESDRGEWNAHAAFLCQALTRRHTRWQARVLTFAHRSWPWLSLLGAAPPLRLSLLGIEVARLIAHSDGATLQTPFNEFPCGG